MGGPKLTQNNQINFPENEIVRLNTEGGVTTQDYAILEENQHSCLDLDAQVMKEMMESSSAGAMNSSSVYNNEGGKHFYLNDMSAQKRHRHLMATAKTHEYKQKSRLPVTNIDFRQAQQYKRQRSGVENPQSKMTYKLPSYASCLRAQIRPKNFTALKQYYELLAKDEKLAMINQKHFFQSMDGHERSIQQAHNKQNASFSRGGNVQETQQNYYQNSNRHNKYQPVKRSVTQHRPNRRSISAMEHSIDSNYSATAAQNHYDQRQQQTIKHQNHHQNNNNMQHYVNQSISRQQQQQQSYNNSRQAANRSVYEMPVSRTSPLNQQLALVPAYEQALGNSIMTGAGQPSHYANSSDNRISQQDVASDAEEMMQAVFELQHGSPTKKKGGDNQHLEDDLNQVTYMRIGSQKMKHKIALKSPNLGIGNNTFDHKQGASQDTFVDQFQGSNIELNNHKGGNRLDQDLHSHKSMLKQSNSKANQQGTTSHFIKHVHGLKSHQQSYNRFGLNKVTHLTQFSSKLLENNHQLTQKRQNEQQQQRTQQLIASDKSDDQIPVSEYTDHLLQNHSIVQPQMMAPFINKNGQNSDIKVDNDSSSVYENNKGGITISDQFQTKLISQQNSEGAFELSQKARSSAQKSNHQPVQKLKGQRTQHDVMKSADTSIDVQQAAANIKKQSTRSNEQMLEVAVEDTSTQNKEQSKKLENNVMSINASDKQIEIAFKTNDVFSSQDDDDLAHLGGIVQSLPINKENSQDSAEMPLDATQNYQNDGLRNQAAASFVPNKRQIVQQHQLFSSQGFSTARDLISPNMSPSKLESTRNITSIEIIQEDTLQATRTKMHQYVAPPKQQFNKDAYTSEIRRQQAKRQNFNKRHDRKMAKTPELHARRTKNNEVQTQVQLGNLDAQTQSLESMQPNLINAGSETLQINDQTQNILSQQQFDKESNSVYQNYQNTFGSNIKATSVHESEMLGLLDMYFGHNNVSLASQKGTLSNSKASNVNVTALNPIPIQTSVHVQHFNSSFGPKQKMENGKNIAPVNQNTIGKSLPARPNAVAKSAAARAAMCHQKRQRSVVSQQQARYVQKRSGAATSLEMHKTTTNMTKQMGLNKSLLLASQQNKTNKVNANNPGANGMLSRAMTKSSNTQKASTFYRSMYVDPAKSLNVKQLKPGSTVQDSDYKHVKTHQSISVESPIKDGRKVNYGRDGETQIREPTTFQSELSVGTPGRADLLPINNSKVSNHIGTALGAFNLNFPNMAASVENSIYSIQEANNTVYLNPLIESAYKNQSNDQNDPSSKAQNPEQVTVMQTKIEEVVVPNVPPVDQSKHGRQIIKHHSDFGVKVNNNYDENQEPQTAALELNMSHSTLDAIGRPQKKQIVQQRRAKNQTQKEVQSSKSGMSLSTELKQDSPLPTVKHQKNPSLIRKSFELDEFGESRLTENGITQNDQTTQYGNRLRLADFGHQSGIALVSEQLSTNKRNKDFEQTNMSIEASDKGVKVSKKSSRINQNYPNESNRAQSQLKSPNSIHTPDDAQSKNKEDAISDRSEKQLHNKTPDFLKVLGYGIDLMQQQQLPQGTIESSSVNQDISLLMIKQNEPQQERDTERIIPLQMTMQSETREEYQTQALQSEIEAPNETLSDEQKTTLNTFLNLKTLPGGEKMPQVTVKSRGEGMVSAAQASYLSQLQLYKSQRSSVQTTNQTIHVQDFATEQDGTVNLMNIQWPYHDGVIQHRNDASSKVSQQISNLSTNRRPQTQQNQALILQEYPMSQEQQQTTAARQNHQRLVSKKRSLPSKSQGRSTKKGAGQRKTKAGGALQHKQSSIVDGKDQSQLNNSQEDKSNTETTMIQGKRFSQTGQTYGSYEDFVKNNMELPQSVLVQTASKAVGNDQKKTGKNSTTSTQAVSKQTITLIAATSSIAKPGTKQEMHSRARTTSLMLEDDTTRNEQNGSDEDKLLDMTPQLRGSNFVHSNTKVIGVIGDFAAGTEALSHTDAMSKASLTKSFQEILAQEEPSTLVKVHGFDADRTGEKRNFMQVLTEKKNSATSLIKLDQMKDKQVGDDLRIKVQNDSVYKDSHTVQDKRNIFQDAMDSKQLSDDISSPSQMMQAGHQQQQQQLLKQEIQNNEVVQLSGNIISPSTKDEIMYKDIASAVNNFSVEGSNQDLGTLFVKAENARRQQQTFGVAVDGAQGGGKNSNEQIATLKKLQAPQISSNNIQAKQIKSQQNSSQHRRERANHTLKLGRAPGGGLHLQAIVLKDHSKNNNKVQIPGEKIVDEISAGEAGCASREDDTLVKNTGRRPSIEKAHDSVDQNYVNVYENTAGGMPVQEAELQLCRDMSTSTVQDYNMVATSGLNYGNDGTNTMASSPEHKAAVARGIKQAVQFNRYDNSKNADNQLSKSPKTNIKLKTKITEIDHETTEVPIKTEEDEQLPTQLLTEQKENNMLNNSLQANSVTTSNINEQTAMIKSNDKPLGQVSGIQIRKSSRHEHDSNKSLINLQVNPFQYSQEQLLMQEMLTMKENSGEKILLLEQTLSSRAHMTKADIELQQKLEAANNVNTIVNDMSQLPQAMIFEDILTDMASKHQRKLQKGLVASIPNMYAYKPKKPFNIQNLSANVTKDKKKNSTIKGVILQNRLRQTEESLLQQKMTESFLAQHENHIQMMNKLNRARTTEPTNNRFVTNSGTQTNNVTIGAPNKSSGYNSIESESGGGTITLKGNLQKNKELGIGTNFNGPYDYSVQTSYDGTGPNGENTPHAGLIIRGGQPFQTQHFQTSQNVEKFISVQDDRDVIKFREQEQKSMADGQIQTDIERDRSNEDLVGVQMVEPKEVYKDAVQHTTNTFEEHLMSVQSADPNFNYQRSKQYVTQGSIASTLQKSQDGMTLVQNNSQIKAKTITRQESSENMPESPWPQGQRTSIDKDEDSSQADQLYLQQKYSSAGHQSLVGNSYDEVKRMGSLRVQKVAGVLTSANPDKQPPAHVDQPAYENPSSKIIKQQVSLIQPDDSVYEDEEEDSAKKSPDNKIYTAMDVRGDAEVQYDEGNVGDKLFAQSQQITIRAKNVPSV